MLVDSVAGWAGMTGFFGVFDIGRVWVSRVVGLDGLSKGRWVFRVRGTVWWRLWEGVAESVPGGGDGCRPSPSGVDAESELAGGFGDAGRHVQNPVAEGADLTGGQIRVVGEADQFGPCYEVSCGEDDFEPGIVGLEAMAG